MLKPCLALKAKNVFIIEDKYNCQASHWRRLYAWFRRQAGFESWSSFILVGNKGTKFTKKIIWFEI